MILGTVVGAMAQQASMNSVDYLIANPLTGTDAKRYYRGEFFEIYGPPQTGDASSSV